MKINNEVKKMIEENPLALATINEQGNPYAIAVADVKVISNNQVLIGDNYMKNTIKNIKQNNNICLAVWENSKGGEAEGYQLRGTAEYFSEGKWYDKAKKIHEGCPTKGAIIVTINKIKKLMS